MLNLVGASPPLLDMTGAVRTALENDNPASGSVIVTNQEAAESTIQFPQLCEVSQYE